MATKYQQYFQKMLDAEKDVFVDFEKLHQEYSQNQEMLQDKYNTEGGKVIKVIHDWEAKLCNQSEKAGYGNFTSKLSEKFMKEVRKKFPMIDFVGVISKKDPKFAIKKISL